MNGDQHNVKAVELTCANTVVQEAHTMIRLSGNMHKSVHSLAIDTQNDMTSSSLFQTPMSINIDIFVPYADAKLFNT